MKGIVIHSPSNIYKKPKNCISASKSIVIDLRASLIRGDEGVTEGIKEGMESLVEVLCDTMGESGDGDLWGGC